MRVEDVRIGQRVEINTDIIALKRYNGKRATVVGLDDAVDCFEIKFEGTGMVEGWSCNFFFLIEEKRIGNVIEVEALKEWLSL